MSVVTVHQAHEQGRTPIGQQQAKRPAQGRQQKRFGQQLTNNAARSGAHGKANSDFSLACRGTRQHQVGHVDAGDEQHQDDHRHQ